MPDRHKLSGMDLRRLRTFVTVAEQGTVSKASLHLRIAQPALSRQIGDLEEELGVRLFDRIRRRLVLTSEGQQLLGECRNVLGAVRLLSERAQQMKRGDSGILRLAATPQTIEGVLSTFLHRYRERRPDVQVRVTEAAGPNLIAKMERGDLDLCISLMRPIQADNLVLDSLQLPPIEFLAACNSAFNPGPGGSVEIGRLARYPLLLLDDTFYVRRTFDAACRVAGIEPHVLVESRAPHALLALAEAGHGVAVVPSVQPTNRYRLRIMRITQRQRPLREPLGVLWDRRRVLPRYARDFCEALAAYMREVFPISRPQRRPRTAARA